jgi:hypothetical protein
MPSLQDRLCTAAREQTAREDRARLLAGVLNALPLALAFWVGVAVICIGPGAIARLVLKILGV